MASEEEPKEEEVHSGSDHFEGAVREHVLARKEREVLGRLRCQRQGPDLDYARQ